MEDFEVVGTTLLGWIVQVQAHDEGEAQEKAERIVKRIALSPTVSYTAHHRIARCRLADPEND
jgi:hypothetical protein